MQGDDANRWGDSSPRTPDFPVPREGELFDNTYRIGEQIGVGGQGVVHEGVIGIRAMCNGDFHGGGA